jgi:predicted phosphodiesterase
MENFPEITEMKADGSYSSQKAIEGTPSQLKDPAYVLEQHGFNPKQFQLTSHKMSVWDSGVDTLHASSVTVKPLQTDDGALLSEVIAGILQDIPAVKPYEPEYPNTTGRNLVIPLADWHVGKTDYEYYAPRIREIQDIIAFGGYDTVVVEVLGDFLHTSSIEQQVTAHGTVLDGKIGLQDAIKDAIQILSEIIETAIKSGSKVKYVAVSGNHDTTTGYLLNVAMGQRYRLFEDVEFNCEYAFRAYTRIGNVLVASVHGDVAKKQLKGLVQNEVREDWAQATWVEVHLGHMHTEEVTNEEGVVSRRFASPAPTDGYEKKNGFTMSHKKIELLEFDNDSLKNIYYI